MPWQRSHGVLCIEAGRYHLIFIFYYGAAYVIFSWIFFAYSGFFFYFFIDWRYPLVLLGYSALLCNLTEPPLPLLARVQHL